ncbi:hypothetical protein B0H13DRAFT_1914967 [Mycena leptocephala]|nr:hypothetical protein B0H13DRAFT_1914967 [Mycena leptocephala]
MVFKENVYASLIDCTQRASARAEGAGDSNVGSWITSELGWNVRRPQVQAPRSRSRDASLLGPCRLKDGAQPLEVQARTTFMLKPGASAGEEFLTSRSLVTRSSACQPFTSDSLQHITVRPLESRIRDQPN